MYLPFAQRFIVPLALRSCIVFPAESEQVRGTLHGKHVQRLQAGIHCVLVVLCRPVYKAHLQRDILPIRADLRREHPTEPLHIRKLFFQIFRIAKLHEIIMLNDDPPHGIGWDIIHPRAVRRFGNNIVQTVANDLLVAEHGLNGCDFRMQISDPDQTVALDAIPDILLHIQMHRIRTNVPDSV